MSYTKKYYRTIWISDVHLGTKGCKADQLNSFLKNHRCDFLFLVGDIIDGWRIKKSKWFWPHSHNQVIRKILRKAEKENTQVLYVAGNHDEFLREYISEHTMSMGNITLVDEAFHSTSSGEQLWIVHGDAYDGITKYHKWVAILGDTGYNFLLWANTHFNSIRKMLGLEYWSLSKAIKNSVKGAVSYIFEFENTVAKEAQKRNVDGVVCGHIHHAEKKEINNINYYNCGDWVESCTALVEDDSGEIQIVTWATKDEDTDSN